MICSTRLTRFTNHFGVSLTSVTAFAWSLLFVWTRRWACIYIYIYMGTFQKGIVSKKGSTQRSPVDDSPRLSWKNEKIRFFKFPRNFAQPFLFIPAYSYGTHSRQVKLSGTNASFGAIDFFSAATVISVQLQSSQRWHYRCVHVQGTSSSHPHPTPPQHRRSIKDVYMCKERHHPIPTPTHPIVVTGERERSRVNI